jgi:hypothetical protein
MPQSVKPTYAGKVRIWVKHWYLPGTYNVPNDGYLTIGSSDWIRNFACYADAKEWIEEQDARTYILANGENDRPSYRIVRAGKLGVVMTAQMVEQWGNG